MARLKGSPHLTQSLDVGLDYASGNGLIDPQEVVLEINYTLCQRLLPGQTIHRGTFPIYAEDKEDLQFKDII